MFDKEKMYLTVYLIFLTQFCKIILNLNRMFIHLELSDFADNIVKRRIEQLPEVAMADMTGLMHKHLQIVPNLNLLESASITLNDIEQALVANNVEPGSMMVRDGYYEYNIKFSSLLRTPEDVRNIYLEKNGKIFQMKDLATVAVARQPESGMSMVNGKRAVTLGVIKQSDETIRSLRQSLQETLNDLERTYPDIAFTVNRNQTELLDYTIANLQENLLLGFLLVFIVAMLFLGDARSPFIIGLSMTTALITTFIFFFLFGHSINIITLSGLILALGNMIDSSIVVTDVITQYRKMGYSLDDACEKGTKEVIMPILSSTLTTIAVFAPLVFMSGIAGAIFAAEAFAVTIGMLVSYITGILLLPVLYKLAYSSHFTPHKLDSFLLHMQQIIDNWLYPFYDRGIRFVFRHKTVSVLILFLSIPLAFLLFKVMPKSTMPQLDYVETIALVEWNENIHIDENEQRILQLLQSAVNPGVENASYIGQQQYLLEKDNDLSLTEAQLYFRTRQSSDIRLLEDGIRKWLTQHYPQAVITFAPPANVFEKIFDTGQAEMITELYPGDRESAPTPETVRSINQWIDDATGEQSEGVPFEQQYNIHIDKEKLMLYGVSYNTVHTALTTAFRSNQVAVLRSFQQYLPISITGEPQSVYQVLRNTLVEGFSRAGSDRAEIPLRELVEIRAGEDVKTIVAGKNGEYIPLRYARLQQPERYLRQTEQLIREKTDWDVLFSGNFFSNRKMINELAVILLVSLLLMFFIFAAQFESFLQPLIVLLEVPVDVAFALMVLWLTGNTLNLMSAIGIVVTIGVIVNDSILKIDLINELRKGGMPLMEAIHTAGSRRLRAIIMTALTSILAMVPILFTFDMGSALQKPLAITMISAMTIGTLVSIFLIPLIYWAIYRRKVE